MSSTFSANSGSLERLKVRMRCGCSRCACHKRCTARRLTPTALAMARPVQCVAWPGGSEQVRSITLATTLAESGAWPALRVLSRSRPSTPCSDADMAVRGLVDQVDEALL